MTKKERIVAKAKELGKENERKYIGCSQSTFAAIVDAFRSEGIELFTPEEQEKVFKGMVGLQGGTGGTSYGTCGAVIGPSFCVSMVSGIGPKEQLENKYAGSVSCANVINGVTSKFVKDFGSINCRDICFRRWGRVLDFCRPDTMREFLEKAKDRPECQDTRCTIAFGAGCGAEQICDIMKIE